jgi:hypothetical protein
VASNMRGVFQLANEALHFSELSFGVPGAQIDLAGDYDMASDNLDLLGTVKFQAKVSQLAAVTGWKRWALKAVDPLFERQGAGTFRALFRLRLDEFFGELLAGLEARIALGRDGDGLAGSRITALALLLLLHHEAAKSA